MPEIRFNVSFTKSSQAGSNITKLIAEMLELAKEQPAGATVSVEYDGATLHAQAGDTPASVYHHYSAAKLKRMVGDLPRHRRYGRRSNRG